MKKIIVSLLAGLLIVLILFSAFVFYRFQSLENHDFSEELRTFSITEEVEKADRKLGQRIYAVRNGCIDCHGEDLAGVLVMDDPAMGTIYGANITPFNLKKWSDEEIAQAIRYGVHPTGRSLKFMPSFDYEALSKSDTAALIAYIRSVESVSKPSHENHFGPIARVLASLNKMPVMFPAHHIDLKKDFANKPEEAASLEFGEYLAKTCVGCHGSEYRGGAIPGGDPSWPKATNIRFGAQPEWTEEKFYQMMETGVSPLTGKNIRPPMPVNLLKQFSDMEKKALWLYLSQLN